MCSYTAMKLALDDKLLMASGVHACGYLKIDTVRLPVNLYHQTLPSLITYGSINWLAMYLLG